MSAFDKIIGYDLVKGELRPLGRHRRGARKKALPDLRRLQEDQSRYRSVAYAVDININRYSHYMNTVWIIHFLCQSIRCFVLFLLRIVLKSVK